MRTKLIILMFHRVCDAQQHFEPTVFATYLQYLIKHYHITLPGKPLDESKVNICLTFDDAYCDFYFYVYPLLQKYNIPAVLGVTTDYIVEQTTLATQTRISVPYPQGMSGDLWCDKVPFCTWVEIQEMHQSGLVEMASHSASHPHLTDPKCDLNKEIIQSKAILTQKLQSTINCFIYPFGDYNSKVHTLVRKHYQYDMRIGSALNKHWETKGPLYRLDAENHWPLNQPLSDKLLRKMHRKYWANRIRGK